MAGDPSRNIGNYGLDRNLDEAQKALAITAKFRNCENRNDRMLIVVATVVCSYYLTVSIEYPSTLE